MRIAVAVCLSALAGTVAAPAVAQQAYDRDSALAISQGVVGEAIGSYTFRDIDGQAFRLDDLKGRPLVVSLIYTSCHHVCPLITASVERNTDIAQEALGADAFSVVSIGFDWQVDTPDRMRMYASAKGIDIPGWHFLSGDEASVNAISKDLGFQFYASAKGFDHLSQTTVIDAEGRVYRQIYGQDFDAQAFVEPLKELVFNTPREAGFIDHWVGTFKLFCTVFDPNTGRYEFDYSIFMTLFVGILCLGALLLFIIYEWRRAR